MNMILLYIYRIVIVVGRISPEGTIKSNYLHSYIVE